MDFYTMESAGRAEGSERPAGPGDFAWFLVIIVAGASISAHMSVPRRAA